MAEQEDSGAPKPTEEPQEAKDAEQPKEASELQPTPAPEPNTQSKSVVPPADADAPKKSITSQEEKKISLQKERLSTKSTESEKHADSMSIGGLIPINSSQDEDEKSDKLSSRAKMVLGSIIDIKSQITAEASGVTRTAKFANTYRLDSQKPFNHEEVEKVLHAVLPEAIEGLSYNAGKCATQAKWATRAIRAKIKEFEYDRYKIVCACTIGEKNSQHYLCTMRFLWDLERDNYAFHILENPHVFVIGYCFGIYYE